MRHHNWEAMRPCFEDDQGEALAGGWQDKGICGGVSSMFIGTKQRTWKMNSVQASLTNQLVELASVASLIPTGLSQDANGLSPRPRGIPRRAGD